MSESQNGKTIQTGYDANSNLTSLITPTGKKVDRSYDTLNRLTGITLDGKSVASYGYNSVTLDTLTLGNGAKTTYGYNAILRFKSSPWQNGGQESYYGKFRLEMDHLNRYESFEILIEAIHHQIHYYNHKRIHTALRTPPVTFREHYELLLGGIREEKREKTSSLESLNILPQRVETGVS